MVDPFSIGAVAGLALTEGIKFLYGQAGEILRRRAERKAAAKAGQAPPAEPIAVEKTPEAFAGSLGPMAVDDDAAEEQAQNLKELRRTIEDHELGDADEAETIRATLALRDALEDIVGQRITFAGEDREPSGTPVATGRLTADVIKGRASGLEIETMKGGRAEGTLEAKEIAEGADAAATRIRNLGG